MGGRDYQRSAVYAAEKAVDGFKTEFRMETVPELQAYVDQLRADPWLLERFPKSKYRAQVTDGRHCRHASATSRRIRMPRWARSRMILLHEFAHVLVRRHFSNDPGHGLEFCRIYLLLVERYMGPVFHVLLKAEFTRRGVRFAYDTEEVPHGGSQVQEASR